MSADIVRSVGRIVSEIGRWDHYLRIFPESDRVQDAAAKLFAQVINYLVRAATFYSANRPCQYSICTLYTSVLSLISYSAVHQSGFIINAGKAEGYLGRH